MRQLIAAEYLSLDGRMEDPGPAGDFEHRGWTMPYGGDKIMWTLTGAKTTSTGVAVLTYEPAA